MSYISVKNTVRQTLYRHRHVADDETMLCFNGRSFTHTEYTMASLAQRASSRTSIMRIAGRGVTRNGANLFAPNGDASVYTRSAHRHDEQHMHIHTLPYQQI